MVHKAATPALLAAGKLRQAQPGGIPSATRFL